MNSQNQKKVRAIPIVSVFYRQLIEFSAYKDPNDRIFVDRHASFIKTMQRSGIVLPAGQLSHSLRHSFASHFVANGGSILSLQKILGHADIKVTKRRYAHLSPDHFQDAIRLNPMAKNWLFKQPITAKIKRLLFFNYLFCKYFYF